MKRYIIIQSKINFQELIGWGSKYFLPTHLNADCLPIDNLVMH